MRRISWITDPHLNFLTPMGLGKFAEEIAEAKPDDVVITGDIAEANSLMFLLDDLYRKVSKLHPTNFWFVCGNHDYYKGGIKDLRENYLKPNYGINSTKPGPRWLQNMGIVELTENTALLGHDGWYDGGWPAYGSFMNSSLGMADYSLIEELRQCQSKAEMNKLICTLAEESADFINYYLPLAFEKYDKVIFATHVSPFPENSRAPNGKISGPDWMPSFCNMRAGKAFLKVMRNMPAEKELKILCGHSHTYAFNQQTKNITCITGGARYRAPGIVDVFEVD